MKARLYCVLALATGMTSIDSAEVAANTALCGEAAWFDAGGMTASGEPGDADSLTAAHPDLPFGTRIEVDNLGNGRSAIVRINDRASFARGRVILVSRAAAEKLGMIHDGTAQVRLNILDSDSVRPARCQDGDNGAGEATAPLPSPNPVAAYRQLGESGSVEPEEQGSAPSEPDPLEMDAASSDSIVSRFAVAFQPESWQEAELAKVLAAIAPRLADPQTSTGARAGPIKRRAKVALPPNGLFPDFMGYLWSTEISMPHLARFERTTSPGLLSQLMR